MAKLMAEDEARILYEDEHVPIYFASYYRYEFRFVGESDKFKISATFGGNPESIEGFTTDKFEQDFPLTFDELKNKYFKIHMIRKSDGAIYEHFDASVYHVRRKQ